MRSSPADRRLHHLGEARRLLRRAARVRAPRAQRSRRVRGLVRSSRDLQPTDRCSVDGLACTVAALTVIHLAGSPAGTPPPTHSTARYASGSSTEQVVRRLTQARFNGREATRRFLTVMSSCRLSRNIHATISNSLIRRCCIVTLLMPSRSAMALLAAGAPGDHANHLAAQVRVPGL